MKKEYLGDSVYVNTSPLGFVLTTENGLPDDPSNIIYLEPEVAKALFDYIKRARKESRLSRGHNA